MRKLVLGTLVLIAVSAVFWLLLPTKQPAPAPPEPARDPAIAVTPHPAANAAVTNIPGIGAVPTDPKALEKFKAKSKRELQAALRKVGVFSDRQDQKQAQDSGEMAWIFIEQRKNLSLAVCRT